MFPFRSSVYAADTRPCTSPGVHKPPSQPVPLSLTFTASLWSICRMSHPGLRRLPDAEEIDAFWRDGVVCLRSVLDD